MNLLAVGRSMLVGAWPAVTVPLGLRADGMPVGVTRIGKPGADGRPLGFAYAFEQATRLRVAPNL